MTFKPSKSLQLGAVLEYLSSTTQVHSSLGSQLDQMKYGISGGDPGDVEQGLLDRADLSNCVAELSKQQTVRWASTDVLPEFARKIRARPGAVAVAVLRAYYPWHCDVDAGRQAGTEGIGADRGPDRGLAEVFVWMQRQSDNPIPEETAEPGKSLTQAFKSGHFKHSREKAAALLADANIIAGEWVDMWNHKAGFRNHITVAEFVARYKVPEATVQRWCLQGKLDAVLVAGQYRIDVSGVSE